MSADGHHGFTQTPAPRAVEELALKAARSVGAGYSAQDWVEGPDGSWWLLDLNPAGQWLFLPKDVSEPVTAAIAQFLDGQS